MDKYDRINSMINAMIHDVRKTLVKLEENELLKK